jgi:hypothetical protein
MDVDAAPDAAGAAPEAADAAPDAGGAAPEAVKPDFQRVLARWNPGFMSSWLIRDARLAVLTVPVLPGFSLGFLVPVRRLTIEAAVQL